MRIPEEHKQTIKKLVEADPEVAQATCDIPHLNPRIWLEKSEKDLPYCGCFIGVYAWMQQCKKKTEIGILYESPKYTVADHTGISLRSLSLFGYWCETPARDHAAVEYARELLDA